MKSLLWKDYRINRLLLIFGVVVCVGPWIIASVWGDYLSVRINDEPPWRAPGFWISACIFSLGLSVFTLAMLGGNAIAAERADRSAEFLAYLPVSRWSVIVSKSLIAFAAGAAIWGVNLFILFVVAPRFENLSYGVDEDTVARIRMMFAVCAAASVLLFGSGWFWSSVLTSHGLATGMSFVVLATVIGVLLALEFVCSWDRFLESWFVSVCLVLGIGGYLAGCAYYLHHLEDVFKDFINGREATV